MAVDARDRCQTVSDPDVVAISGSIFVWFCAYHTALKSKMTSSACVADPHTFTKRSSVLTRYEVFQSLLPRRTEFHMPRIGSAGSRLPPREEHNFLDEVPHEMSIGIFL